MSQSFIFKCVYGLLSASIKVSQCLLNVWVRICTKFPIIRIYVQYLYTRGLLLMVYLEHTINTRLYGICAEPVESSWSLITNMDDNNIVEDYQYKPNMDKSDLVDIATTQYNQIMQTENEKMTKDVTYSITEYLQSVKYNESYWYRVISAAEIARNNHNYEIALNSDISDVRFLSVGYSHPQMKDMIYFELPKSIYIVGNQILSSTFILRYLKYHFAANDTYVFDNTYIIEVMDDNINQFDLKYGNYCILNKSGYTIV